MIQNLEKYEKDIEACRAVIRDYNKKKREAQPAKPKPTRRTLLKKKVMALIKLTPKGLIGESAIQKENRQIVKSTIRAFMKNWGMNSVKQVESTVDKEFDRIEEKIETQEQKELALQWSRDLPHTDQIIAYEKKHNQDLLEEAALEIVDHITEAIELYKKDKKQAFKYLKSKLNQDQLQEYLPQYIFEEMNQKTKS